MTAEKDTFYFNLDAGEAKHIRIYEPIRLARQTERFGIAIPYDRLPPSVQDVFAFGRHPSGLLNATSLTRTPVAIYDADGRDRKAMEWLAEQTRFAELRNQSRDSILGLWPLRLDCQWYLQKPPVHMRGPGCDGTEGTPRLSVERIRIYSQNEMICLYTAECDSDWVEKK